MKYLGIAVILIVLALIAIGLHYYFTQVAPAQPKTVAQPKVASKTEAIQKEIALNIVELNSSSDSKITQMEGHNYSVCLGKPNAWAEILLEIPTDQQSRTATAIFKFSLEKGFGASSKAPVSAKLLYKASPDWVCRFGKYKNLRSRCDYTITVPIASKADFLGLQLARNSNCQKPGKLTGKIKLIFLRLEQ